MCLSFPCSHFLFLHFEFASTKCKFLQFFTGIKILIRSEQIFCLNKNVSMSKRQNQKKRLACISLLHATSDLLYFTWNLKLFSVRHLQWISSVTGMHCKTVVVVAFICICKATVCCESILTFKRQFFFGLFVFVCPLQEVLATSSSGWSLGLCCCCSTSPSQTVLSPAGKNTSCCPSSFPPCGLPSSPTLWSGWWVQS